MRHTHVLAAVPVTARSKSARGILDFKLLEAVEISNTAKRMHTYIYISFLYVKTNRQILKKQIEQ